MKIYKNIVSASIIITGPDGEQTFVVKEFSTFTDDLYRLKSWLSSHACPVIAMESTSVYWRPVHNLESQVEALTKRLDRILIPNQELIDQLDKVPGIDKKTAQSIIGHIGYTLTDFRSDKALASWGGLCPGNNESAGKRKSGRSAVRKHPFKELMIEIAWAAVRKKGAYYKDKYYRLKSRRGAKRAVVAIAHRITKAVYHIIKHGRACVDLGEAYLISKSKEKRIKILKMNAKHLGFSLVPVDIN